MEGFVENELINLRFFSDASGQNQSSWSDINKTRERIALVLEFISFLKTNYSNKEEVDGRFLFVVKSIAQNIHILKQRLKSTYDRLPWEEMEFCLVVFVSSRTKLQQELNLFYRAILNKTKILKYMENFANELGGEKDITKGDKLYCLPRKEKREIVVTKIIATYPQFEELYNDHQQIRDIYSLQKISDNINLALLADPLEKEGRLVITRVLQVIGELIKNTLESPNLSHTTSELLVLSLPKNTRKLIVDLRNAISHANALSARIQIEEKADSFFVNIQNDIKKVGNVIIDILYKNKIKTIRILLTKIVNSANSDEIKEVIEELSVVDLYKLVSLTTENFKTIEHKKIEKFLKKLSVSITDKTDYENELFQKITSIIDCAGSESEIARFDYMVGFQYLRKFSLEFNDNKTDPYVMKVIKQDANIALQNIVPKIERGRLEKIGELLRKLFHSVESRKHHTKFDKIKRITSEILYILEFKTGGINWIEELREELAEEESPTKKQLNFIEGKNCHNLLAPKLLELKSILNKNTLTGPLINALDCYKKDNKMESVVEMLVLDIMTILGTSSKNFLENNLLCLDDDTPLLNGKCLRNYLAHDNALVDMSLSDPSRAVLLNARKLTEENIMRTETKIGKLVRENPAKLREKFHQNLITITNQERMFVALEEGDLDSLENCLLKGADIKARSVNLWTTLHFAAKGCSLEIVKFILDHNSSANVKDNDGQTPLHIAAAYGRQTIVEFFITEAGLCVDELTNRKETPLHFAAKNGHKGTVEILIKNKANTSTHDIRGLLPLHYAIMNNHIYVAKSMLEKEVNVDINETIGGSTPLHVAANHGHLELVTFILEIGANVNAIDDNNATPLHSAANNNHLEVVKTLILNGANINTGDWYSLTPLHYAAEWGNLEITNILLKHKAYVNATLSAVENVTALHVAIQSGHLKVVAALVKHGADIHFKSSKDTTLHCAAFYGRPEVVEFLIENGAEINAKGNNNIIALHLAASQGHKDVTRLLIKSKAEVNAPDIQGYTPLHAAASNGSIDIIDLLIKNGADVNSKSVGDVTPLQSAVRKGHKAAAYFLIRKEAVVNAKDIIGLTPLHLAALHNHKSIVKLLIENKAHVHDKSFDDYTALRIAARAGHQEIVEILVAQQAHINDKSYLMAPLFDAIRCNHKEIVEVLLKNGANISSRDIDAWSLPVLVGYKDIVEMLLKNQEYVNYKDFEQFTPLHFAAREGHKKIVKMLITKGGDINAVGINNTTPVFLASQNGYEEVVTMLLAGGADVNIKFKHNATPLHAAAIKGHSNVVKVLLDYKVDINVRASNNETSLQSACRHGHLEVVKLLLQYKNVNMDVKGNDDVTLLHIASQGNNIELVKYLVDHGCDINARDSNGLKPIHIAAEEDRKETVGFFLNMGLSITDSDEFNLTLLHCAASKGHLEIVKYLVEQGADVNVQDNNGSTPMHVAAYFGHKNVIDILLRNGAMYNTFDRCSETPLKMTKNKDVVNLLASTEMLFKAVERNNSLEAQTYITAGAFVSAKNAESQTPLHYAAWKGYDEVVNVLLQNNANPNVVDNKGITPLHCAAESSHLKIVKALLSNCAVYDAISVCGKTPSDLTIDKDIANLFKLVSKAFKNIKVGNSRVINTLSKIKDIEIVKSIMCARNRENKTLVVAAIHSNFSQVQQLKEISQDGVATRINEADELLRLGHYQKALPILKSVFEIRKEILGPDNPGTLDIRKRLVEILIHRCAYEVALETSEEIFHKEKEILGLNNKDTLITRCLIASVMHSQGKNEEAFDLFQEVYRKQKEMLGPNHLDTLNTQLNIAKVLNRQGKYKEALYINKSIYDKINCADHSTVLHVQCNIAHVLTNQGNHEEALKIYKEALEMAEKIGMDHFGTLNILSGIARVLHLQKKYHKSLKAYNAVLNIQKKVLEPNHLDTLTTQCNIGNILYLQGKWIGALKAYRECFDQMKTVFGSNNPNVLDISEQIETINLEFKFRGSDPSKILQYLQNEIYIVACRGDSYTLQSLLDDGADANVKDIDGRTPLYHAVYNGHLHIVNMLLKYSADVTQATNKGDTPLHTAADKGYKEIVEVLLQHVNRNKLNDFIDAKTTASGATALHVAAQNGHLDIAKSLLKRGAIYDITNNHGKTPLDLSTVQDVSNFLKIVEELFEDAKIGNVEIINKLKSLKTDEVVAAAHARNNRTHTMLQVVIVNGYSDLARKLSQELKIQTKL